MSQEQLKFVDAKAVNAGEAQGALDNIIDGKLAVCFKGFFSADEADKMSKAFYQAKPEWTELFDGDQFCLGESWYPYSEQDLEFELYSSRVDEGRAKIEKYMPGLEDKVLSFLSHLAGPAPVEVRDGWAGPGVMLFPANGYVAVNGGSCHHDTDAFDDAELAAPDLKMFSFVCMLQKPKSGGDLQVWDLPYDHKKHRNQVEQLDLSNRANATVQYQPGDLWMFNGMNPHQIHGFQGDTDRVALTFHAYKTEDGWRVWF